MVSAKPGARFPLEAMQKLQSSKTGALVSAIRDRGLAKTWVKPAGKHLCWGANPYVNRP